MVPFQEAQNEQLVYNTTEKAEKEKKLLCRLFLENDLDKIDNGSLIRRRDRSVSSFGGKRTRMDSFEDVRFARKQRDQSWDESGDADFKDNVTIDRHHMIPNMFRRTSSFGSFTDKEDRKESSWLIPVDHKIKFIWDFATVVVSLISAFHSHASIRDRSFGYSPLAIFCEAWFLVDIILNFVTQIRAGGIVYKNWKSVLARYLTTWFVIDVVSLIPWERHYVKPIVEIQKRRNFWQKSFFRTRAVVRVTARVVKGRHFQLFGKVAKATKPAGVGARRLLHLLIKYLPKYIFFIRRMKGIVVMRILRQVHHLRKLIKDFFTKTNDSSSNDGDSITKATSKRNSSLDRHEAEEEAKVGVY
mmetsp:Transcript_22320/g.32949  ORF Transcript_22320/g.32949 Transcript_22320/m.32949 type:complete len:358 (+) Transcript_22320:63-1136(+)